MVVIAVTLAGFATHNTLGTAGSRILTTFLPLLAAWGLLGFHGRVFDPDQAVSVSRVWRPFMTMILAAPVFGLLRAWMLGVDSISATFLVVMGGISALSMLVWRILFALAWRGKTAGPNG
jgi:hypothetical protein